MTIPRATITSPKSFGRMTPKQRKQIIRFFEDMLDKVPLTVEGAQHLIKNGGGFQDGTGEVIKHLSIPNQFANEEVQSNYTYPPEYDGPKPVVEQVTTLAEILNLDSTNALEYAKNLPELPAGAEGWFAIPSQSGLEKLFPEIKNDAERYFVGVLIHKKIADSRNFYNYRDGQITPNRLRVHARTAHALDLVSRNQPGDILIVAGQLGMRHRGRSVRRARECFDENEFGLGALAVGSIVLTHPTRLVRWEELDMDCSGNDFNDPDSVVRFGRAPLFFWSFGGVKFGTERVSRARDCYGSASAFLPQ